MATIVFTAGMNENDVSLAYKQRLEVMHDPNAVQIGDAIIRGDLEAVKTHLPDTFLSEDGEEIQVTYHEEYIATCVALAVLMGQDEILTYLMGVRWHVEIWKSNDLMITRFSYFWRPMMTHNPKTFGLLMTTLVSPDSDRLIPRILSAHPSVMSIPRAGVYVMKMIKMGRKNAAIAMIQANLLLGHSPVRALLEPIVPMTHAEMNENDPHEESKINVDPYLATTLALIFKHAPETTKYREHILRTLYSIKDVGSVRVLKEAGVSLDIHKSVLPTQSGGETGAPIYITENDMQEVQEYHFAYYHWLVSNSLTRRIPPFEPQGWDRAATLHNALYLQEYNDIY